jgi:hypothetical protein
MMDGKHLNKFFSKGKSIDNSKQPKKRKKEIVKYTNNIPSSSILWVNSKIIL